jgi:hypothetical protein
MFLTGEVISPVIAITYDVIMYDAIMYDAIIGHTREI